MSREAAYPVHPLFIDRWSNRAFTGEPISERDLYTAFEAARWAPSASNLQPWRFVFAHADSPRFDEFHSLLASRNRIWAARASALIFILSHKTLVRDDKVQPSPSHAFDTGAAWSNFAHQAFLLGYRTRAIGGFDRARAPEVLGVPDDYDILAGVAIGRPDHPDSLDDSFRHQEKPSARRPLESFVFQDHYTGNPA